MQAIENLEARNAALPALGFSDILVFPNHKRAFLQRNPVEGGTLELTLYYGDKEITFDEPDQFQFGEMLSRQARFAAGEAAQWTGNDWPKARALLQDLVLHGVLHHADDTPQDTHGIDRDDQPSPLPPAHCQSPLTWSESTMALLTGKALEPGYLELVVPVFRTGHLYLDRDGRQVGEANVFPAAARLEISTQWRKCTYPGSRYQLDKPMNVTALRAMRVHWRQIMALVLKIRAAYLERFPAARAGWTVGDLERLATAVLALPTYMVLRKDAPVENGGLHPALSNMFRVTDGLRLTMHQMLFVPFYEKMLTPDTPVSAEQIFAYAERNYAFHSAEAVCAGPKFMIEEFLNVIVNGAEPKSGMPRMLDPEVEEAVGLIAPAMDYAMLGLQAFGTIFSLWPAMTRAYHEIFAALDHWEGDAAAIIELRQRFTGHFERLTNGTHLASEEWRVHREAVYDDMYAQCVAAITGQAPQESLSARLQPRPSEASTLAGQALRDAIVRHVGPHSTTNIPIVDELAGKIVDYLDRARAIIAVGEEIQAQTNALLGREMPTRRFCLADIDIHNILLGDDVRRLPFLTDELGDLFGITIHVDAETISIVPAQPDFACSQPLQVGSKSHDAGESHALSRRSPALVTGRPMPAIPAPQSHSADNSGRITTCSTAQN